MTASQFDLMIVTWLAVFVSLVPTITGLVLVAIKGWGQIKDQWLEINNHSAQINTLSKEVNGNLTARIQSEVQNALRNSGNTAATTGPDGVRNSNG